MALRKAAHALELGCIRAAPESSMQAGRAQPFPVLKRAEVSSIVHCAGHLCHHKVASLPDSADDALLLQSGCAAESKDLAKGKSVLQLSHSACRQLAFLNGITCFSILA